MVVESVRVMVLVSGREVEDVLLGVGALSWSCMPLFGGGVLREEGVEVGEPEAAAKNRDVNGLVEGRADVRTKRSVSRLLDS